MQWNDLEEEDCSMARTLSVIGDRWTLLVLRECFLRVRRFDDFHARLPIGRPLLASRLQRLVSNFVLSKVAYQQNPMRYEYRLTPKGLDLYPIVLAISHWGDVHMSGRKGRPLLHHHVPCGHVFDPVMTCSECAKALDPREVRVSLGSGSRNPARLPLESVPLARPRTKKPLTRRSRQRGLPKQ